MAKAKKKAVKKAAARATKKAKKKAVPKKGAKKAAAKGVARTGRTAQAAGKKTAAKKASAKKASAKKAPPKKSKRASRTKVPQRGNAAEPLPAAPASPSLGGTMEGVDANEPRLGDG